MPTLEQERAGFALAKAQDLGEHADKYNKLVQGFPATILTDGLGQAVATLMAKAGKERHRGKLLEHLDEWLCRKNATSPYFRQTRLIDAIVGGSQQDYVLAQAEALNLLVWLKKFASAYAPGDSGQTGQGRDGDD